MGPSFPGNTIFFTGCTIMLQKINGIDYFYQVSGEGEPIVLLHGFTGDSSTWDNIHLGGAFQKITIDILGHGKTESPLDSKRYSMNNVAEDIATILDQLSIKQAHILGYSMGGRLALSFAMKHPNRVRSLLLESSSPGLKTKVERKNRIIQDEKLCKMIHDEGIAKFVDYWERIPLFESQQLLSIEIRNRIRNQRLKNNPIGLMNSLRGMGTGVQPSWWDKLDQLTMPVLLMCGELDEKYCVLAQRMKELILHANLVEFSGLGHAIHVEDPGKFDTIVKNFLLNIKKEG